MQTSERGILALASREAIVLSTYLDVVQVPTIGVGHTAAAGAPQPTSGLALTLEDVLALFRRDLAKYEAGVSKAIKVPVSQAEFDALISFHYETGAIAKANLTKALNKGDRAGAAAGFMGWLKPKSITGRRRSERDQFAKGLYPDTRHVPVYDHWPGHPRLVPTEGLFKPLAAPVSPSSLPTSIRRPAPAPTGFWAWLASLFH